MRSPQRHTIHRKDYTPPVFGIEVIEMAFDLDSEATVVSTRMTLVRQSNGVLKLNGEDLELLFVAIDGRTLTQKQYELTEDTLVLEGVSDRCMLDIAVRIRPNANTSLMGLYGSEGDLFTQCEAEGFRKITYFPDRPDVMARFTVMLRADRKKFPVLLSNGNLIEAGKLPGGRHYAKWQDPYPKPSYLFALVAGRLSFIEKQITTQSGREAVLQIYAAKRDLNKLGHAMDSLVKAVRWDERRFGLELDLERFMVVAVGDFNLGAMENKGLNIFNTKYVLGNAETVTDDDFAAIESVIGHEYFHNWTGNRVTCRDWFQLTLKEGLTVFRDQEFSADMGAGYLEGEAHGKHGATARAVNRIENVRALRAAQFPEDAGPMAHPIRPESYQEIGNFYTATVYEKGAEVVRMLQTLLGCEGFRAGLDEYFRRHDGQAVTCDDFVSALESVYIGQHPGRKLEQFRLWYRQAGTPRVTARSSYDDAAQRFTLSLSQVCPKVGIERAKTEHKAPFHIPFAIGLLGPDGRDLEIRIEGESGKHMGTVPMTTCVLDFTQAEQTFVMEDVAAAPVPSLLRNFSAPVIVDYAYSDSDLAHLSAHDSDPFNRWEASQRLATRELVRLAHAVTDGEMLELSPRIFDVYRAILADPELDCSLKELALSLPSENTIGEHLPVYDPAAVHAAHQFASKALALHLADVWRNTYQSHHDRGPYAFEAVKAGRRALKNRALLYLMETQDPAAHRLAWQQFEKANNMTDRLGALVALVNHSAKKRERALQEFYRTARADALVVDKWLRVQAGARRLDSSVLEVVKALMRHDAFSLRNPNKVYALLAPFFNSNPAEFHRPDGAAYEFWADQVLALDKINPTVAGRIARSMDRWRKLTPPLQAVARTALLRVQRGPHLSKDVEEIIEKALEH